MAIQLCLKCFFFIKGSLNLINIIAGSISIVIEKEKKKKRMRMNGGKGERKDSGR